MSRVFFIDGTRINNREETAPPVQYPFIPEIAKRFAHLERQGDDISAFSFSPEAPFDEFHSGHVNRDNSRRQAILVGQNSLKRMLYSRYLYRVYLFAAFGALIPHGLEVDHIDNDPRNDTLINLQLLTYAENTRKHAAFCGFVLFVLKCPICRRIFSRERVESPRAIGRKRKISCCSPDCQNTLRSIRVDRTVQFRQQVAWLSHHQLIYVAKIFDDEKYTIPRCEISEFGSRKMLSKDWVLTDDGGVPINLGIPRYMPLLVKMNLILDYKRQGIPDFQISKILQIPHSTVRYALYGVP